MPKRRTDEQSPAKVGQVSLLTTNLLPYFNRTFFSGGQILIDILLMAEVICNHAISIRECHSRVSLNDGLWGCSVLEGTDYQFQEDTGLTDAETPDESLRRGGASVWIVMLIGQPFSTRQPFSSNSAAK